MAQLSIGTTLGGYRIEQMAGRGGMGVVYRAEQLALGRQVALKVISPELAEDPGFRERFKHESRIAASIDHPNVIAVHEAGEVDGLLFLSMRYVEGTDLRELIRDTGRVPTARAARIVMQVAAALDAAHARGLVHRDVKPANVLIAAGDADHAFLTDFGLTKHLESASGLTNTGQWVGTADYVAPEQIQGAPIDARTDVYALGCMLFQMLTGEVPFPRDSQVAKIYAHLSEPPPHLDYASLGLPAELNDVVRRAMAKAPADRFQSAGDLGRAAQAAIEQRPLDQPERSVATGTAAPAPASGQASGAATRQQPQPRRRTPSWLPAAAAGAVLALIAGVAIAVATGALGGGSDTPKAATHAKSTRPSTTGGTLTKAQVQSVLDEYAQALTNEDVSALDRLFAAKFVQRDPPQPPQDRKQALQTYKDQFDKFDNPSFEYTYVSITVDKGSGVAYVDFTAAADNQPVVKGSIDFHMISAGDRVAIDEIKISD